MANQKGQSGFVGFGGMKRISDLHISFISNIETQFRDSATNPNKIIGRKITGAIINIHMYVLSKRRVCRALNNCQQVRMPQGTSREKTNRVHYKLIVSL